MNLCTNTKILLISIDLLEFDWVFSKWGMNMRNIGMKLGLISIVFLLLNGCYSYPTTRYVYQGEYYPDNNYYYPNGYIPPQPPVYCWTLSGFYCK